MYHFESLNDWEFECLCKDVIKKKTGVELRCFKKGRDGGIDVADTNTLNSLIIQCKNYNSSFAILFSSLKKEVEKVKRIHPKKFFVCTSMSLTPQNIQDIYELFADYMESIDYIWDGYRINDYLNDSENVDIVHKYYKLWIESTNVMELLHNREVMIDSAVLVDQIQGKQKLYVKTAFYSLAQRLLNEKQALLITGSPGVGKTTISNMLILYALSKDYSIRYSTSNDIGKIKQAISNNPIVKELIYIDDFLGQSYLELKSDKINELHSLISYVKSYKNKLIILNSRITVHNEAGKRFETYYEMLTKLNVAFIDVSQMSNLDKAKILYNHLYFCDVDEERIAQIRNDKNYMRIISHKNYNPRLIEHISNKILYEKHSPDKYYDFIIDTLNHPRRIWENEYKYNLCPADRLLLETLFSLTNDAIEAKTVKTAFDYRIKSEKSIDTSSNDFYDSLKRLNGCFIKFIDDKGLFKISVYNPSVNDYLQCAIDVPEKQRIIETAYYVDQISKMNDDFFNSDLLYELADSGHIFTYKTLRYPIAYYYVIGLRNGKSKRFKFSESFFKSLDEHKGIFRFSIFSSSLSKLLSESFFEINSEIVPYVLNEKNIENLFNCLEREDLFRFADVLLNHLAIYHYEMLDSVWAMLKLKIIDRIESYYLEDVDDNIDSFVDQSFSTYKSDYDEWDNIESRLEEDVDETVKSFIEEKVQREFPMTFANGKCVIQASEIELNNVYSNYDSTEAIEQRIKDYDFDPDMEDEAKEAYYSAREEQAEIDDMFDR